MIMCHALPMPADISNYWNTINVQCWRLAFAQLRMDLMFKGLGTRPNVHSSSSPHVGSVLLLYGYHPNQIGGFSNP